MTRKQTRQTTIHGKTLEDDYYWLRERESPEVREYLEAENERTRLAMEPTRELQDALYSEFKDRLKETDLSVPLRRGDYLYYSRTEEGKQYPIYCRKRGTIAADEQVLLDLNEFSQAGAGYLKLGSLELSPDHRLLAYSLDLEGSEHFTIHVREIDSGRDLPDLIKGSYDSAAWASDNQTLFYTVLDEAHRPYKVFRHQLGTSATEDVEVFHEPDDRFFVNVALSKSEQFIFIGLYSQVTSEIHFLDAAQPEASATLFAARQQGVEYSVYHHDSCFFVLTNEEALNFRLMEVPIDSRQRSSWREIMPHSTEVKLDALDVFRDHLVVYGRCEGLSSIWVIDLFTRERHRISFDEAVYSVSPASNPEYDARVLRFHYSSLVTPPSVYDYDMTTHHRELLKQKEVLGSFDASQYISERLWATADDGTRIPISIVYRRGFAPDGSHPGLLYGYGSYGICIDPTFSLTRISLLDRGLVFAIAHVRGGGEMGRPWYEAGKLLAKKNTFSDFIACAEHLIHENYVGAGRLAIEGGSAGGLLMGAVTNLRPELFHVVMAHVPFVDVINTMLDDTLPLTVIEYEEWGDPNDAEFFEYMASYSPYDQVEARAYPHILVRAGLNDPRVQYWEPAKWVAKLREMKTNDSQLLLKTEMSSGHAGPSGRYDRLKEIAFDYAFLLKCLEVGGVDRS